MAEKRDEDARLSLIMRKFIQAFDDPEYFTKPCARLPFVEIFYSFYGTLIDLSTLCEVLSHPGQPELRPAMLAGYRRKLLGDYPAVFLDQSSKEVIHGMAYKVRS